MNLLAPRHAVLDYIYPLYMSLMWRATNVSIRSYISYRLKNREFHSSVMRETLAFETIPLRIHGNSER